MAEVEAATSRRGDRADATWAVALGRAQLAALSWDRATEIFTSALHLDQDCPGAARGLGDACLGARIPVLAVSAYRMALRLEPDDPELLNSLGTALFETGDITGASRCYTHALAVRPDYPDAIGNHGTLLKRLGDLEGALAAYDAALRLAPASPELHYNRGNCLDRLGRFAEAAAAFDRAMALRPGFTVASWNRTLGLLSAGRLGEAWDGFERRHEIPGFTPPALSFLTPRWQGEPLAGRTLLLQCEQGMGDTIHFARFAAEVGGRVVMMVQAPLVRLLRRTPSIAEVVAEGDPLPTHDIHLPLLSLPSVLGTTLETIPPPLPLTVARRLLPLAPPAVPSDLAVGLVWAGSAAHANDANRSMPFTALESLLDLPGIRFYSLQVGRNPDDRRAPHPAVFDLAPGFADFADTAEAMAALDLLVSVDTSAAHLGGTLGVPTLLLLPEHPDWRWMRDRADTPWYPSVTLLRQRRPGEWAPLIDAVRTRLIDMVVDRARQDPAPLNRSGAARLDAGDLAGATRCFAVLQRAHPYAIEPLVNYAAVLERQGDPANALLLLDHAVDRRPAQALLHLNRGNCLDALNRQDEAVTAFDRALALDPDLSKAHWNRTLSLLAAGRLEEAWDGHEGRWEAPGCPAPRPDYAQPVWNGEALGGRTILLHPEQGLGDTIQFIRYAPLIGARGGRVVLRCPPALLPLLRDAPGIDDAVPFGGPLPPFDCYLPLLSAPRIFATSLDTIPAGGAYLQASPLTLAPRDLPGDDQAALKVGLVWAGNASHLNNTRRSASLAALNGLLDVPGVRYFSLQVGPEALRTPHRTITNLAPLLTDFAATARAVATMDLVVSVDTAVAHLAGALGCETLLLLPPVPDWRWMREGTRTPWYRSLHLLRQPAREAAAAPSAKSWSEPVARGRAALAAVAAARRTFLQSAPSTPARELTVS